MSTVLEAAPDQELDEADAPARVPPLPEFFEIINGEVREVLPMSDYAGEVADRLNTAVKSYLIGNPIGRCSTERLYHIPQPDDPGRNRRPDLAYVSFGRWPENRPYEFRANARDVVPDLVCEVVSPTDDAEDLLSKVREYHRGTVRLVWVIYPGLQEVHAHWPGANTIRVYAGTDELDAGDILPGFRTAVAPLFPPVAPA